MCNSGDFTGRYTGISKVWIILGAVALIFAIFNIVIGFQDLPDIEPGVESEQPIVQSVPEGAADITHAKTVRIIDGDTAEFQLLNGDIVTVRFYGINTPERGKSLYTEATESLAAMIEGKYVLLEGLGQDRYGRLIAKVYVDTSANQVASGMAKWYEHYAPEDTLLRDLEDSAKTSRLGIWSDGGSPSQEQVQEQSSGDNDKCPSSQSGKHNAVFSANSGRFRCSECGRFVNPPPEHGQP